MNKQFAILIPIVLIFLLSGCTLQQEKKEDNSFFLSTSDSLNVEFLEHFPRETVFSADTFDVGVKIDNTGEYDIPNNSIYVSLNNAGAFGIQNENSKKVLSTGILYGNKKVPGSSEPFKYPAHQIFFRNLNYKGQLLTEESPVSISVDVCSPYLTSAVSDLCISTDYESDVCEPVGSRPVQSSSGPIKVLSVEQKSNGYVSDNIVSTSVWFTFQKIDNSKEILSGQGSCSDLNYYDDLDYISVESIEIGNSNQYLTEEQIRNSCGGESEVHFASDGIGKLKCTFLISGVGNDYLERLVIKLKYLINVHASTEVKVIPSN